MSSSSSAGPAVSRDAPTVDRAERSRAPISERTGSRVRAPCQGASHWASSEEAARLSLSATPQAAAGIELAQPGDDRRAGSGRRVGCKLINDRHGLRGGDLGRRGEQRRHDDGLLTVRAPPVVPPTGKVSAQRSRSRSRTPSRIRSRIASPVVGPAHRKNVEQSVQVGRQLEVPDGRNGREEGRRAMS